VVTDIHDDFKQQHSHIQRLLQRLEAEGKEVVLTHWNAVGAVCGNECALVVPEGQKKSKSSCGSSEGLGSEGVGSDGAAGGAAGSGKRKDRNIHRHVDAGMAIWRPGRVREAIAMQCQPYDEFAQEFVEGCTTIPR
jgi:hypothetical protein